MATERRGLYFMFLDPPLRSFWIRYWSDLLVTTEVLLNAFSLLVVRYSVVLRRRGTDVQGLGG